jgi:hypothetical protein
MMAVVRPENDVLRADSRGSSQHGRRSVRCSQDCSSPGLG